MLFFPRSFSWQKKEKLEVAEIAENVLPLAAYNKGIYIEHPELE